MAPHIFCDLERLLRPPADFGRRCRAAMQDDAGSGTRLRELASYAPAGNHFSITPVVGKGDHDGTRGARSAGTALGLITTSTTLILNVRAPVVF